MKLNINDLNVSFLVLGIISAISCVIWCIYEYHLDLDLSLVDHKTYGEKDEYIPPAISLCFADPFIEKNIQKYDLNVTSMDYKHFLQGTIWDERMLKIDFENVTKHLIDYIDGYTVIWENLTHQHFPDIRLLKEPFKRPYLSYVGFSFEVLVKCYTTEIPLNASTLFFKTTNDIFTDGIRPSLVGFSSMIHYPNQILTALDSLKNDWPNRRNKSTESYFMLFKIETVEIIIRRNTRRNKCNENWKTDGSEVLKQFVAKNKCKTTYQIGESNYPYCGSKEKMALGNFAWSKRHLYPYPCQHIEKVWYGYEEYDTMDMESANKQFASSELGSVLMLKNPNHTTFNTNFHLKSSKFKVVMHKKAYDLQTLVGNCGGYIGLILGSLKFFCVK